ncbi:enolase N-terminal-like fold-containing protein, partial [Magnetospirillum fulvum]
MFAPTKAPWISPGVVIHEPGASVNEMIAKFARAVAGRGFIVGGCLRLGDETVDLASGQPMDGSTLDAAARSLRAAMRDDADLAVVGGFEAFRHAATELTAAVGEGASQGMPVLTTIPDGSVQHWHDFVGTGGALIPPAMRGLWRWWGPERLYRDLALGVAADEVRQIVIGPRWLMVEGPAGAGLAYLPRNARDLIGRLPEFRKMSLKQLAEFSGSWDPLEMALGVAAIN